MKNYVNSSLLGVTFYTPSKYQNMIGFLLVQKGDILLASDAWKKTIIKNTDKRLKNDYKKRRMKKKNVIKRSLSIAFDFYWFLIVARVDQMSCFPVFPN